MGYEPTGNVSVSLDTMPLAAQINSQALRNIDICDLAQCELYS